MWWQLGVREILSLIKNSILFHMVVGSKWGLVRHCFGNWVLWDTTIAQVFFKDIHNLLISLLFGGVRRVYNGFLTES